MTVAASSGTERRRKLPARGAASSPSHGLVLAEIAGMIEAAGLQIGSGDRDFGNCCLRQNLGGNIVDRSIGDFMNEADVLYSPDATRAMTSRRVISGSTTASRPRRP
jgi:hypothetical protein